jgi:hypothetical protein
LLLDRLKNTCLEIDLNVCHSVLFLGSKGE